MRIVVVFGDTNSNGHGPPTLGGVLDGFSNGEGENPLPFSLTPRNAGGWGGGG